MVTNIADATTPTGQAIRHSIADARFDEVRQIERDARIWRAISIGIAVLAFVGIAPAIAGPENTDFVLIIGLVSGLLMWGFFYKRKKK